MAFLRRQRSEYSEMLDRLLVFPLLLPFVYEFPVS